jgi:D-alanine-D-alanine ligase
VGISKAHGPLELDAAMSEAFRYARKVVLERGLENVREIECAVLGNDDPVASACGEVMPRGHEFYDYAAKYLDADGAELRIPADLPVALAESIQRMAVAAFQAVECWGMARVDFFVDQQGAVWINEINTIPGFTSISMYPKLWEASGLPYGDLIERLLDLAVERHDEERAKTSDARELQP